MASENLLNLNTDNGMKRFLQRVQIFFFFLMIITTPILFLPKRFCLPGLGANLSFYMLVFGLLCYILEIILCFEKCELNGLVKRMLVCTLIWGTVCSILGVISYPYLDTVNLTESKLYRLFMLLGIDLSSSIGKQFFLLTKSIQLVITDLVKSFGCLLWTYHLYKDCNYFTFVRFRSFVFVFGICLAIYAIPEILVFKFGYEDAVKVLEVCNPYLYDVKSCLGWYPPVIWFSQLRSYASEPSVLGGAIAFVLPFAFLHLVGLKKRRVLACIGCVILVALDIMTQARSAFVTLVLNVILILIFPLFYLRSNKKWVLYIMGIVVCGVILGMFDFRNVASQVQVIPVGKALKSSLSEYKERNIDTIFSTTARSNGSRLQNILSHVNVIVEKPLFGTGDGMKELYVYHNLTDGAKKNQEMQMFTQTVREKGSFGGYGNVNEYVVRATERGVLGLIIFLMPYALFLCKSYFIMTKNTNLVDLVPMVIYVLVCMADMMRGSYGMLAFVCLGIGYAMIDEYTKDLSEDNLPNRV